MTLNALRASMLAVALIGVAGCGSEVDTITGELNPPAGHAPAGWAVQVLPESLLGDAALAGITVSLSETATVTTAVISLQGASGLRALFCDVGYDPAAYTPLSAGATGLLGNEGTVLELAQLDNPGAVHLGQVLVHPLEQPGFSGDGIVATIRFAHAPFSRNRTASDAPLNEAARVQLMDTAAGELAWYHTNQGDYDQNGLVSAADLVPVAMYYNDSVTPDKFAGHDNRSLVDGDSNGLINISDITFVGMNFGNSILGGFNVYTSTTENDYPSVNADPNGNAAILLGNMPLKNIDPGEPVNERRYYAFAVTQPAAGSYYWVRPVDGDGHEGTPSTLLTNLGVRAPRNDQSRSPARLDASNNTLIWYYYNAGDNNLDGTVSTADVTLIGQSLLQLGPFHPDSLPGIIDANQDNVINQDEIDLLSAYSGNTVAGYNIYCSSNSGDYPATNRSASVIGRIGFVPFSAMINSVPDGLYRPYFVYQTSDPSLYHWVRPVDALGNEGTPSVLQHPLLSEAHVPLSGSSITFPTWDSETNVCKWYYYNAGDYDQSSIVIAADLGVIGTHFGNIGPFEQNSLDAVIDGNRDGVISELDVDLVGKYFNNQVAGYNVYLSSTAADYAFGSTNPSTIDPIATIDYNDFLGAKNTERIWFEYEIPAETAGYYLWMRPFNGAGLEGVSSNLILRTD